MIAEQMLVVNSAKEFWDELVKGMGKLLHHNFTCLKRKRVTCNKTVQV